MIVPILASLNAVAAADAFASVKQNASGLAVPEPRRGNQIAVFHQTCRWSFGHVRPFSEQCDAAHISLPLRESTLTSGERTPDVAESVWI